jgi:hypothetical protein
MLKFSKIKSKNLKLIYQKESDDVNIKNKNDYNTKVI